MDEFSHVSIVYKLGQIESELKSNTEKLDDLIAAVKENNSSFDKRLTVLENMKVQIWTIAAVVGAVVAFGKDFIIGLISPHG